MAESFSSGESVFPLTVRVVEGHALRNVFEVPISAGALDRDLIDEDQADPNEGSYILLEGHLASDGGSIVVREKDHPKAKCAAVLAEHAEPALAKHRKMIQAACRSVGTYVWRGNRFVRGAAPVAPGPAPTPTGRGGTSSF